MRRARAPLTGIMEPRATTDVAITDVRFVQAEPTALQAQAWRHLWRLLLQDSGVGSCDRKAKENPAPTGADTAQEE
jgi:hypothetical protein